MIVYRNSAGKILTHNGKILIPSDFSGYIVQLPVLPTGVTEINYVYTDFTTNQESNLDASTVTPQTIIVPKNCSVSATVTCPSWSALKDSYGPWTITGDTVLPTPTIQFNTGPIRTTYSATTKTITVYYKNNTSIPVNIIAKAYTGSTQVGTTQSALNLAANSVTFLTFSGFSPGTTYTFKAYYVDPASNIATNTDKVTTTRLTTAGDGSQS